MRMAVRPQAKKFKVCLYFSKVGHADSAHCLRFKRNRFSSNKHCAKIHHILAERFPGFYHPSETTSAAVALPDVYASGAHVEHVTKMLFIEYK